MGKDKVLSNVRTEGQGGATNRMMGPIAFIRAALAVGVIVTATAAAQAASPEDNYIAARDAAIQKITALEDAKEGERASQEHDRAFADLQQQMRGIIGPVAIKGLAATGKLNLSTLSSGDEGFGMLDGLVFASADDKISVIVTTESLFGRWLVGHKDWWGDKIANVPQTAREALVSDMFYSQAIQTDAAVMKFARLPVGKPANATFTFAMLAARSQDNSPPTPDEIFVAVVQGVRIYIADAPVERKFAEIPACNQIRKDQETKADAVYAVYEKAEKKDEKLSDQSTAAREEADTLFLRCYAERAANQPAFAQAVTQAQSLLERLPLR